MPRRAVLPTPRRAGRSSLSSLLRLYLGWVSSASKMPLSTIREHGKLPIARDGPVSESDVHGLDTL